MASAFKPKGRLTCKMKFTDQHGAYVTRATDLKDRRNARSLAEKVEADAARLRAGLQPEHPEATGRYLTLVVPQRQQPVAEALKLYLADLKRQGAAAATIRHRDYKLRRLAKQCKWKRLADVSAESLTRHLAALAEAGRAASTTNAYRDCVTAFLDWCVAQKWLTENEARGVKPAPVRRDGPFRRRAFLPEELRALLAAAPRRRDLYLTAALSGLRHKEIHLIERRDVDLQARVWRIRPEVDKARRAWTVPILPALLPTLTRLCLPLEPTDRLFPRRLGNGTLDKDLAEAKLTKLAPDGRRLNFHSLRYTYCTFLARKLPIQRVKELMRHTTMKRTADTYMDLGLDDLGQAVAELPALFDAGIAPGTTPPETRRFAG